MCNNKNQIITIKHITVAREISEGQLAQILSENGCAKRLIGAKWEHVCYQSEKPNHPSVKRIPLTFRPLFLRNIFAWMLCIKYSLITDYILLRHLTFDPFSPFFSLFVSNRASVHHAKEIEELLLIRQGWKGKVASAIEKYTAPFVLRKSVVIIGVTSEIAKYQRHRAKKAVPIAVLPNGIDPTQFSIICDCRAPNAINVAFVCGKFSAWHGLDLLINKIKDCKSLSTMSTKIPMVFHLIGELSETQIMQVQSIVGCACKIVIHGFLKDDQIEKILTVCDGALGSLAMHRTNLVEGSTLKVRQMLASGIPVFSGHKDTALPDTFEFFLYKKDWDLGDVMTFCLEMRKYSRSDVAKAAVLFIQKEPFMNDIVDILKQIRLNQNVNANCTTH